MLVNTTSAMERWSLLGGAADGGTMLPAFTESGARSRDATRDALAWTLRIGAFLCFVGHGAFGVIAKEAWVAYFAVAGIGRETAYALMPLVGALDITMGVLMLLTPRPAIAYWMVGWALWTALLRPLAGEPVWETLERAGNYGVPAALLALMVPVRTARDLVGPMRLRPLSDATIATLRRVLTLAVALLLAGHGALGVTGKAGIVANYASVLPADLAPVVTVWTGWAEIALAGLVLLRPRPGLLIAVCLWKLATEALFLTAGAPLWEFIERGGSYAAPVALAIVLIVQARRHGRRSG